jgi:hypothetical protein
VSVGNCVEVARLANGDIAVRNSRFPDGILLESGGHGRFAMPARRHTA